MDLKTAGDKMGTHSSFFLLVLSSDLKIQKGFQVLGKPGFREGADAAKSMSQIYNYDLKRDTVSSEGHV